MENSRWSKNVFRLWIAAMITLAFSTGCHCQSTYPVGKVNKASVSLSIVNNIPWQPYADPNWAISVLPKDVEVDSYLVFLYSRTDNYTVYRVDEVNYQQCDSSNPLEKVDFGASVSLPQPGVYYYIDGNQSLCQKGNMRLQVDVLDPKFGPRGIGNVIVPAFVISLSVAFAVACFIICRYRKHTAPRRYQDRFLVYSRSYERPYELKAEKAKASKNKILIDSLLKDQNGNKLCTLFTLKELEVATSTFSRGNELGSGAFGTVYKGMLRDGRVVAVKRANTHRGTDVEQFVNEVSILSLVNHRNLVKLLGCCLDLMVPLLVFEFIPNGSLEEHLRLAQHGYSTKLNWPRRFKIAMETAEALKYLHWEATPQIIHRDVKAANILLDEDFGVKVVDFGLSKLVDVGGTHIFTVIRGTPGYMDPEYYFNSQLTDKSDVYSYGIVLLELITSKRPIDLSLEPREQNLALRLVPMIKSRCTRDIIDKQLIRGFSEEDFLMVEAVAEVAVACLVRERASRPTMKEVVEMLQYIRGSNLQADTFFKREEITNEGHQIDPSLPFTNLSSIFRSFNCGDLSWSDVKARDHILPQSSSSCDRPFTISPIARLRLL